MVYECEHKRVYRGLSYTHGDQTIPGGSASRRYYAHVYFCERCGQKWYETVSSDETSYSPLVSTATPDNGVPREGNTYSRY